LADVVDRPLLTLPTVSARPERADASRNRARILSAAEQLFDERGVENVSMDEIAACAGVGKGTLYRRFGDRSGLAIALLDAREAEFQEQLLRGEPPLGPGAPPAERLHAFLVAMADQVEAHLPLFIDSETSSRWARYRRGPYASWHQHAAVLLRQIDAELDAEVLAHQLLSTLAADHYSYLRIDQGMSHERVVGGICQMLRAVGA
jgi:AcrR family transcriptional regulator